MKIENRNYNLYLCLKYKKHIDFNKFGNVYSQIQPGDLEIAYNGGCENKYIVLGLPDDNMNDDAGYLVYGTYFKSAFKEWMKNNNLKIGKEFCRSELLDYHSLYSKFSSNQWKIFDLNEIEGDL